MKDTSILYKTPPVTHGRVVVTPVGIPSRPTHVYFFSDVLEELIYGAAQRAERGILTGRHFAVSSDTDLSKSGENTKSDNGHASSESPRDFIEVTAFKDIYPTDKALEYAGYLRRIRDFRNPDDPSVNLGMAVMFQQNADLMLEDLLVQRSYFAHPWQIAVFIDASRRSAKVYMLDDDASQLLETGFFIIRAKDSELPVNLSPSDG